MKILMIFVTSLVQFKANDANCFKFQNRFDLNQSLKNFVILIQNQF